MKPAQRIYFVSLIAVFALLFLLIPLLQYKPIIVYSLVYISASLLFILICGFILKHDIPARYVWVTLGLSVLLRLSLIAVSPTGSDDYYRYVWDGKVMAHGINPYRYAPDDPALAGLHSETLPARVNFAGMRTIYPPVAEALFYVAYKIAGANFLGIKVLLFVFEMMTIYGIYLIIRKLKLSGKNILLYALCPLPLFQFLVDGHVDGFGITLLVFSVFFYLDGKKTLSYLFIALSVCVKPTGLILIPVLFFLERDFRERIKVVLVPVGICALLYIPFVFSGYPFQALLKFTENWTFNGIVFDILNALIHDNQISRSICGIMFILAFLPVLFSRKDLATKIYNSIFLLLIFSPVVHPWYLSWLAILLPVRTRWSGILYVSLVSLTLITVMNYQLTGVWKEYPVILFLEYAPVLTAFVIELAGMRRDHGVEPA
ncbi:MAG: glycosyltransferase 87 family protein [Bacteroidetes bacterium]|nr:glycosyltransferase 87 family protein [Bacteroidota bacterium]